MITNFFLHKDIYESSKGWRDGISPEQQQAIDQSLAQVKTGKVTPHEDVIKKYRKWQKNDLRDPSKLKY